MSISPTKQLVPQSLCLSLQNNGHEGALLKDKSRLQPNQDPIHRFQVLWTFPGAFCLYGSAIPSVMIDSSLLLEEMNELSEVCLHFTEGVGCLEIRQQLLRSTRAVQMLRNNCYCLLGVELQHFQVETKSFENTIDAASVPTGRNVLWKAGF